MTTKYIFCFALFLIIFFSVTVNALTLTVNSPEDNKIYSTKNIFVSLEADDNSDFYYLDKLNPRPRWIQLCRNTKLCEKTIRADEGVNSLTFKTINKSEEFKTEEVEFSIDSKKPKILDTFPDTNRIVNDLEFNITYTEENLEEIELFYGAGIDVRNELETACESGKEKVCKFEELDLSDFEGRKILLWFVVRDTAGNSATSKMNIVEVDSTLPEILSQDYSIDKQRVNFIFEIEEKNFDKVYYKDKMELRPRVETLCSRLNLGLCSTSKMFKRGQHKLDVWVVDKAGNLEDIYIDEEFMIY